MQFPGKLLDKNEKWLWLELDQVDLVAAAKLLHRWKKNEGKYSVARALETKVIMKQNF